MNKVNDRWEKKEKSNKNIGARGDKSTIDRFCGWENGENWDDMKRKWGELK